MAVKDVMFVGSVGGGAQLRSATSRAFTAQHWGVLSRPGQRTERLKAGMAMVEAPKRTVAMMVGKCIVDDLKRWAWVFGICE